MGNTERSECTETSLALLTGALLLKLLLTCWMRGFASFPLLVKPGGSAQSEER